MLDRIEAEAGVTADVIDGLEEARLIFGVIRAAVLIDPGPALCFDLGGGSLEIMVGDSSGLLYSASERLGVARLTAEYVTSDPISKGDRRRLHEHLVDVLGPIAVEIAGSTRRWRSAAAARSRTSPTWSRPGATSRRRVRSTSSRSAATSSFPSTRSSS